MTNIISTDLANEILIYSTLALSGKILEFVSEPLKLKGNIKFWRSTNISWKFFESSSSFSTKSNKERSCSKNTSLSLSISKSCLSEYSIYYKSSNLEISKFSFLKRRELPLHGLICNSKLNNGGHPPSPDFSMYVWLNSLLSPYSHFLNDLEFDLCSSVSIKCLQLASELCFIIWLSWKCKLELISFAGVSWSTNHTMDKEPVDSILGDCAKSNSCVNWWLHSSWKVDYYCLGIKTPNFPIMISLLIIYSYSALKENNENLWVGIL